MALEHKGRAFDNELFSGPTVRGGGYLVNTGSQWFLQGLYVDNIVLRRSDLMLAMDLRDQELRSWLRREIDNLESRVYRERGENWGVPLSSRKFRNNSEQVHGEIHRNFRTIAKKI